MSNPFHREEEMAPIADVNVVPLADVSLVLLIILLVLSPMTAQSMLRVQSAAAKAQETTPPPAEPAPLQPPAPVLAVGLSPAGYKINGRLFPTDSALRSWLTRELSSRSDPNEKKVFLSPDLDMQHGQVVGAIEIIQACGASAVALVQVQDPQTGN